MSEEKISSHKDLKEAVLHRLEKEKIEPRSRLYWLSHEYALWGAWGVTILLGAASLAVLSFVSLHISYALYEATHDNFLTFFIDSLPYVWLAAFGVMILAAHFNLRHTKHGYRYSVVMVAGSSVGFSVLGAGALHFLGAGYYLDRVLGEVVTSYESRVEFEEKIWQKPALGRLVGRLNEVGDSETAQKAVFVDIDDHHWDLELSQIRERDRALLESGRKVRLLTATSSRDQRESLFVCAVFPWLLDHAPFLEEFKEERKAFGEGLREGYERTRKAVPGVGQRPPAGEERVKEFVSDETMVVDGDSPCAKLPIFQNSPPKTIAPAQSQN